MDNYMPLAKEGYEIKKGTRKFRLLVGSHCEGVQVGPKDTDIEQVIYTAGEYIETNRNLNHYSKHGPQFAKFEEVPFETSHRDRKRYSDPMSYSNDPSNPGEITPQQKANEEIAEMKRDYNRMKAEAAQRDAKDAKREEQMAALMQQLATLQEQLAKKNDKK